MNIVNYTWKRKLPFLSILRNKNVHVSTMNYSQSNYVASMKPEKKSKHFMINHNILENAIYCKGM